MHSLHPQARTTPAVRQEIARSTEPTGVLAQRFSVSTETIRKWRKRGVQDCQDHSSRPHKLPWKATEEERAIVCALRQATGFPLDDLTFIVSHFLPHLNRDAVYRILKAEGLGRLPPAQQRKRKSGTFKDYDLGFVHMDIKHLPKLRPPMASAASASCMWPSTAARAGCIWRSRTTSWPPARSPS